MAVVTQSMGSVMGKCDHSAMQPRIKLEMAPIFELPVMPTYLLIGVSERDDGGYVDRQRDEEFRMHYSWIKLKAD